MRAISTFMSIWIANFSDCSTNNEVEMISYSIVCAMEEKKMKIWKKQQHQQQQQALKSIERELHSSFSLSQWCSIQCQSNVIVSWMSLYVCMSSTLLFGSAVVAIASPIDHYIVKRCNPVSGVRLYICMQHHFRWTIPMNRYCFWCIFTICRSKLLVSCSDAFIETVQTRFSFGQQPNKCCKHR